MRGACTVLNIFYMHRLEDGLKSLPGCFSVHEHLNNPALICPLCGVARARAIQLGEGARLYAEQSMGDCIYVVRSGVIMESIVGADGQGVVVRLVTRGGATGLAALLGDAHRSTATVMEAADLCRIPVADLNALRVDFPETYIALLKLWHAALDDSRALIASFCHGSAQARLARFLLFRQQHAGEGGAFRLRRRDVVALLGITGVSASRLLGLFKQQAWVVEEVRYCKVVNPQALTELTDQGDHAAT